MMTWWKQIPNTALAAWLTRWMLGILFTVAGWWKVFTLTPSAHAQKFFVEGFADHWIPEWLLTTIGTVIPFAELAAGLALLAGLWTRLTLTAVGLLLLLTTYGHALQQPLFDIDGHTFTRFVLLIFLLMLPKGADIFSLDHWLSRKGNRD